MIFALVAVFLTFLLKQSIQMTALGDEQIAQSYQIVSQKTQILIQDTTQCNAQVKDIVNFELQNGRQQMLIRRLSLKPNLEDFINFKVTSSDIQIIDQTAIPNCEDYNNHKLDMNDICISITFSEILIKPQETKQVTVTYEYTAVSIVKKEQDPFSDKIYNTIIYTIDNSNRDLIIQNVDLSLNFITQSYLQSDLVKIFPSGYHLTEEDVELESILVAGTTKKFKNIQQIDWHFSQIKLGELVAFGIKTPEIIRNCEDLSKKKTESANLVFLIWIIIVIVAFSLLAYIYRIQYTTFKQSRPKYEKLIKQD